MCGERGIACHGHFADRAGWQHFVQVWLAAALASMFGCAGLLIASDPFYIWQEKPPWLETRQGGNLNLDLRHRLWKPLALGRRSADIVLIGSSRTYRGLDPADVKIGSPSVAPNKDRVFNFGISSLSLVEIEAIAGFLAVQNPTARPRQVIIGLDEYMFNVLGTAPAGAIPRDIAAPEWHWRTLLRTIASLEALRGLVDLWIRHPLESGTWLRNGFKTSPPRPARDTVALYGWQQFHDKPFLPERLIDLRRMLARFNESHFALHVYISPISGPMQARLQEAGRWQEYQTLRAAISEASRDIGLSFSDLATDHPFQDFDPTAGSSPDWIDHHHFTPHVGRWILSRLGLRPDDR